MSGVKGLTRTSRVFTGFFGTFTAMGIACITAGFSLLNDGKTPQLIAEGFVGFGTIWIVFGALATAWYASLRIEAEENGLRWRDLRGWHQVGWDEVRDFYFQCGQVLVDRTTPSYFVIETKMGQEVRFGHDWHGVKSFQTAVVRHAGERCGVSAWAPFGTRPRDFPFTFAYRNEHLRKGLRFAILPAIILFMAVSIAGYLLSLPAAGHPQTHPLSIDAELLAMGVWALFCGGFGWVSLEPYREAHRRIEESFTAQRDGFVFSFGGENVFVPWNTVIGYDFTVGRWRGRSSLRPTAMRIRTERGQEFTFTLLLGDVRVWKEVVRKYATDGIEAKIDGERVEALGGVAALWSSGVEGKGAHVFSSWTRSNRMLALLLPILLSVVSLCKLGVALCGLADGSPLPNLICLLFSVILGGVALTILPRIRVEIDREAIAYRRPWRTERVLWGEIERVEQSGDSLVLLGGKTGNEPLLRVRSGTLAYGSRIVPLIEERVRLAARESPRDADVAATTPPAEPRYR